MNLDAIIDFWTTKFEISADKLPIQECVTEDAALLLFKEAYPHIQVNEETYTLDFRRVSLSAGIGLRHFTPLLSGNKTFYNAKRLIPKKHSISLSLLNTQGLITNTKNKCSFLHGLINNSTQEHIIAITETHLTDQHLDAEITNTFQNYTLHRSDRNTEVGRKSKNGGVLLLSSPGILCTKGEKEYSNGCCELLINELPELNTTIITIYRPPDSTRDEFSDILKRIRSYLNSHTHKDIIITGDFNFPSEVVEWRHMDIGIVPFPSAVRTDERKLQLQDLIDLSDEFFLQQTISKPTRKTNILNLIFSNATHMLHSPLVVPTQISDHHLIQFLTDYNSEVGKQQPQSYDRPEISTFNF